ncbi:MAG: hypothetical protein AAFX81_11640 [Pseudomonadota bacterium]
MDLAPFVARLLLARRFTTTSAVYAPPSRLASATVVPWVAGLGRVA